MNPRELKEIWQASLGELEVLLSKANFTTWFKDTFILSSDQNEIIIGVPNAFTKEWLENKYHDQIFATLKKLIPQTKSVKYKVAFSSQIPQPKIAADISAPEQSEHAHPTLNNNYLFNNFVVGNSNRLAAATAQAVAQKPGKAYNPLFLYGGVGLGKTHLIQAIGNEIISRNPKKRIIYVSCEKFTNDFVSSISNGKINDFKKNYRDADAFLVDDIQFLAGKEGTQEEFFHTFNSLHQGDRQIVITSDRVPKAIPQLQERLSSRLGWGMVADIQPPNLEMRQAILKAKSEEKELNLDEETVLYIAQNIESNIRELEGAVTRIKSYTELNRITPSLDIATKVLADTITQKGKNLTVEKILKAVGDFFNIDSHEILSPKRNKELVWPRQIIMYLLRHEMNLSFPKIGQELNKKDHTTIMYGVGKIEKEIGQNEDLKQELTIIKEKLFIA